MATKKNDWVDWLKTIIITAIIVILFRMFIAVPIVVEGPSMLPTLENKDRLIVNKFSLMFSEPDRFDVVVFHATAKKDYIKRVIGLPGDSVIYKDDQLYINGEPVAEPFLDKGIDKDRSRYTANFTLEDIAGNSEIVPEGHVFVLGDNRPNSTDSRHLGYIPVEQIVGIAGVTYWPFENIGLVK
ncbi:signal peptidase I [Gracilibacillus massiliensis]|uniref:signal peptidase I n=1 Tax=Gracilibacillus massiliensis TaxID=1564956 RepID=UPI00071D3D3B|nr:signal peptidase I [Gracilibacillus massiliensis]